MSLTEKKKKNKQTKAPRKFRQSRLQISELSFWRILIKAHLNAEPSSPASGIPTLERNYFRLALAALKAWRT